MYSRIVVAALLALGSSIVTAAGIPGKVAFIGADDQLYVADPNGGTPQALTSGALGRGQKFIWPTWSPDGLTIAAIGYSGFAGAGIYRLDPARPGTISAIYEHPLNPPFYVSYAPTGDAVATLILEGDALSLTLLRGSNGEMHRLGHGRPYYFSWRPDGDAIVTHPGFFSEVSLIDLRAVRAGGKPTITKLSADPVPFRAPAWSPDGSYVAYVLRRDEGSGPSLVVRSRAGRERRLVAVSSPPVFTWAPDGKTLAIAEAVKFGSTPFFNNVDLVRLSDGHRDTLYTGTVGAFFWSPDGSQLLIAAPDFDSSDWRWQVVNRADRRVREIARFVPNQGFETLAQGFDQYAQSYNLWAPDSRHFIYFGYPGGESEGVPETIWVADAKTAASRRVADGTVAFWSPR
jgi:WD40 repeat protein